jgi:hypothetical protein
MAADAWAPGRRRSTHVDTAVCLRRRKPRLNLGRVCVSADRPAKMHRAAGLGFSSARSKRTKTDGCCPFASGRWRCPNGGKIC